MTHRTMTKEQMDRLLTAPRDLDREPQAVSDSSFLRILASLERQRLNRLMAEQRFAHGEVIMSEGETGDALYIIWSGQVLVFVGDVTCPTILGYRGAGEILGEMALLENRPRSASVVAVGDVRLLKISRDKFYELLQNETDIGLKIMGVLSSRLRGAEQHRTKAEVSEKSLITQVIELRSEKQHLLDLQRLRQEMSDLIVHDLRNPLGTIFTSVHMLAMVLPERVIEENRQLLEIAQANCERMSRLVDSLLDMSRMESGEIKPVLADADMGEIIRGTVAHFFIPPDRNIDFDVEIAVDLPLVQVDKDKIERVVANLLDNALKFTPDGGKIRVRVDAQQSFVLVSVCDSGPGIPPGERGRIFERFAQVEGGKRRQGFGLGLSYCRLAVEAHRGKIWAEGGEGNVGSRFIFSLPAKI